MKTKPKITIVDYGVGNLKSLARAFEYCGADVKISEESAVITNSDAIVLPGDGAFAAGMQGLKVRGLTDVVKDFAESQKPILGICLGAQLLLSVGYEFGMRKGLDLISGQVVKFPKNLGEKIPQIGWNALLSTGNKPWKDTILVKVKSGSSVYFIHSYIMVPKKTNSQIALSKYGNCEFASVIGQGNIWGCQFHPEKSGDVGLTIINNFISII